VSYTAITLTGDRPRAFAICREWVARQSVPPTQWVVVDDGRIPLKNIPSCHYIRRQPRNNDPTHTLALNLRLAIQVVTMPRVIIFEDDDWYHRQYAEVMLRLLKNVSLAGLGRMIYYHMVTREFHHFPKRPHSSLASTAFDSKLIPRILKLTRNDLSPSVDIKLWGEDVMKAIMSFDTIYHLGLKGMPGRKGLTLGHTKFSMYEGDDKDLVFLINCIGEDIKKYREILA